jgi:hypothetical protein
MPTYVHSCTKCSSNTEIFYSMDFVGKEEGLPKDILKQITCKKHGLMPRVPQEPHLAGSSNGTFKSEKELLNEKQSQRKLRSKIHFKNEVLPTIKGTPLEKRHFKNKLKNLPKKDHEKM